jgi:hypothetical protein
MFIFPLFDLVLRDVRVVSRGFFLLPVSFFVKQRFYFSQVFIPPQILLSCSFSLLRVTVLAERELRCRPDSRVSFPIARRSAEPSIPFQSSFFVKRKSLGRVLLRLGSNPCTRLIFPYCPSVAARFVSGALRFQASRWVESSRARFCCAPLGSGFLRRFAFSFPLARRPWDRYFRAPAAVCSLVFWSSS